jgi:hypothetical protein
MAGRTKKKKVRINTRQAVERLDKMIPILFQNLQNALLIEATMEAGNNIVGQMPDRSFPGARSYSRIMRSLAFDLAMHLARLYDKGARTRHDNEKDIASIPLAVRLLRQKRCQKALSIRARNWLPHDNTFAGIFEQDCLKAIERASQSYSNTFLGPHGRGGLKVLKEFRNNFLAHSLMNDSDANPIYNHLYKLTDSARDFVQDAQLAIKGKGDDLVRHEKIFEEDATRFWRMALLGERGDTE